MSYVIYHSVGHPSTGPDGTVGAGTPYRSAVLLGANTALSAPSAVPLNSLWRVLGMLYPLVITTFITTFNGFITTFLPKGPTAGALTDKITFFLT